METPASTPPTDAAHACIALGANLGDRAGAIRAALAALDRLPGVEVLRTSSLHETDAVTLPGAEPQPAYCNAAAVVATTLRPEALLDALLRIERDLGRDREDAARWAPRMIDLDLLLYADRVIDAPGLRVPHPRMHERAFVLDPLAEIALNWRHPTLGATVAELRARLDRRVRGSGLAGVAVACLLAMLAPGAAAQVTNDTDPPASQTEDAAPVTPAEALARMQSAYAGDPVGERIEIVARSSGEVRRDGLTLRVAPTAVRIDFDGLAAFATAEAMTLAHVPSGRGRVTPASDGETRFGLIDRMLPPLPLPQLVVLRQGAGVTALPPLCENLRWFSATEVDDLLLVEGVGDACSASLALDRSTWRLASATLRGRTNAGPISVEIRVEGFDPGPVADWSLDGGSIQPIESLAELAPREGDIRPGDAAPDLLLLTPDATPWRLSAELAEASSPRALLLFREDTPAARDALDAAERAAAEGAEGLATIVGVVLPASGVEPLARLDALADHWGDGLLWTVSADTTLGRFAPDSVGALVVIDAGGVVRLIEPIENRASDIPSLTRRIVASLSPEE